MVATLRIKLLVQPTFGKNKLKFFLTNGFRVSIIYIYSEKIKTK